MLSLAAAAAVDPQQTQTWAEGLAKNPLPYFLALVMGVVVVLWGALTTVAWWGAKGRERLQTENYRRELERNQDLRKERDEARDRREQLERERVQLAMETVATAAGLAGIRGDLDKRAAQLEEDRAQVVKERAQLAQERRALKKQGAAP